MMETASFLENVINDMTLIGEGRDLKYYCRC